MTKFCPHILIAICFSINLTYAQSELFAKWDSLVVIRANTAIGDSGLTAEERNIFLFTNLARMDGKLFASTFLKYFTDSINRTPDKWSKSLIKTLNKLPELEPLQPRSDLNKEAKKHAMDMGKSGKMGHSSSKGKSYPKRMADLAKIYETVSENCQYGYNRGLAIVADLLIDENWKSLGHRKHILDPDARYMGVSIQKHKKFKVNSVQEFATKLK